MANLHIGDCVAFRDRAFFVLGLSPMSVLPRLVQLEGVYTGEQVEASVDDVRRKARQAVVDQAEADRRLIAKATGRIVPFRPNS